MIPTFRPVVYAHHKRKDGTYNVKINVYFNGKERRLPTTIFCTKADLTRSCHIKNGDILNLCNKEIIRMREAIADISFFDLETKDVDWLVNKIRAKLTAADFRLDFFIFADKFLEDKKEQTRSAYISALNTYAKFLGARYIDINDITKKQIESFVEFCNNQTKIWYNVKEKRNMYSDKVSKKGQAAARHINRLSTIFNAAKKKYNDEDEGNLLIPRSPFDNIELAPIVSEGQKPLSQELMQKIILADVPARCRGQRIALDVLVVSFGLMGANVADLLEAKTPKNGIWEYERKKTRDRRIDRARMRVNVPKDLSPYLERLGAGTGEYWLPELRKYSDHQRISTMINQNIRKWCENEGIKPFTLYAVRKSWATLGRRVADKSIVDEGLAHKGDFDLTDIYADRPWDKINKANADVLALFEWPQ